jgi:hypothetical protein
MVGQRQHAKPQSPGSGDHPATGAVDLDARAHRKDATGTQMHQGVGQRLGTEIEHVIVRQACDARPYGL